LIHRFIPYVVIFLLLLRPAVYAQKIDGNEVIDKMEELSIDNIQDAIQYADSMLQYEFDNKGKVYAKCGYFCLKRHDYEKAIGVLTKAEALLSNKNESSNLAYVLLDLGQANAMTDKKDIAVAYVLEAIKIAKANDYKGVEAESYTVLATIYSQYNDYDKSIKYAKTAYEIQRELKDTLAISVACNNLAVYFERAEILDSALFYHLKGLSLKKLTASKFSIAISYHNIAKTTYKMKDYNQAISYYKKSISLFEELESDLVMPYINLAAVYNAQIQLDSAKHYNYIALELSQKNNNTKEQEEIYTSLLSIAIRQSDFEKSLLFLGKRDSLNTLNITKENEEKIRLIDGQYENAKREEKLKQTLEISRKNQIIFAVFSGFLIFLGLFLMQRSRNAKLKAVQERIVLEQKVLRAQMNPHFIFNVLGAIQKTLLDNDPLKSASSISRFSKLIRQNFEFMSKDLISIEEDLDALKNYLETQQLRFESKFDFKITVQSGMDTSFVKIPPMLLQPFVENAIEHGLKRKKEKGLLQISISKKGEFYYFEIIDNGVGYKESNKEANREHATDIFLKRLKLRGFGEEKLFSIQPLKGVNGTKVTIVLNLK